MRETQDGDAHRMRPRAPPPGSRPHIQSTLPHTQLYTPRRARPRTRSLDSLTRDRSALSLRPPKNVTETTLLLPLWLACVVTDGPRHSASHSAVPSALCLSRSPLTAHASSCPHHKGSTAQHSTAQHSTAQHSTEHARSTRSRTHTHTTRTGARAAQRTRPSLPRKCQAHWDAAQPPQPSTPARRGEGASSPRSHAGPTAYSARWPSFCVAQYVGRRIRDCVDEDEEVFRDDGDGSGAPPRSFVSREDLRARDGVGGPVSKAGISRELRRSRATP
jgi:hypothetical protein